MSRIISTYCNFHLGDQFCALHLLRYIALRHPEIIFRHYAHEGYAEELAPFTEGAPNLTIHSRESGVPHGAIDTWKNAGEFWAEHPEKWDYARFTRRFYRRLIRKLGLRDPEPGLLFDLPELSKPLPADYDVLVVNSNPMSGQFLNYDGEECLTPMVNALAAKGHRVLATKPVSGVDCARTWSLTCAQIGALSNRIPHHVMVSTGPSWFTFNVFNQRQIQTRILMCEKERVDLTGDTINCRSIAETMRALGERGLI